MAYTVYEKCKDLLDNVKSRDIGLNALRTLIMIKIGSQKGTITNAIKTMMETNLIRDVGAGRFEILR